MSKKFDLARIRTWNLLIRSQTRYPLRHKALACLSRLLKIFSIKHLLSLTKVEGAKMSKFSILFFTHNQNKAQTGFEPVIFGLRDRRLTTWPLRQLTHTPKYSTTYIKMEQAAICAQNPFFPLVHEF